MKGLQVQATGNGGDNRGRYIGPGVGSIGFSIDFKGRRSFIV